MSIETRIMHRILEKGKVVGYVEIIGSKVFIYKKHAKKPTKTMTLARLIKVLCN